MTSAENTPAPVDLGTAQRIDSALREQTRTVAHAMAHWRPLIEEARTKRIHGVLGFPSWPAYVSDVIHSHMGALMPQDRLRVVEVLSAEGMSQRAIAEAVGVSQKTVDRDLDRLSHDDSVELPPKVTSLDGKQRPAHPPRPKPPVPQPITDPAPAPVDDGVALVNLDAETPTQVPIPGPQRPAESTKKPTGRDRPTRREDLEYELEDARQQIEQLKAELAERDQLIAELREELKLAKAKAPTAKATESQEDRLLRGVLAKLANGPMSNGDLCSKFESKDRPAVREVLEKACADGLVTATPTKRGSAVWDLAEQSDTEKAS